MLTLAVTTLAYMSLWYPPPLGGTLEANPLTTQVDNELNFPIGCCDSHGKPTLPSPGDCRGHIDLLDTEEGRPQVTWEPGQDAYFQLSDHTYTTGAPGSTHHGGSCQIGFSVDKGQTWKVAASYHGNCPHRQQDSLQTFQFKVPFNMPSGPAVFAWIWLNREHEFFMNCASVQIGSSSGYSTMSVYASSTIGSTIYHTALPAPTDGIRRKGETYECGNRDRVSTSRDRWSSQKLTRSRWEHTKYRHSSKHHRYYYMHRAHRDQSPRQHYHMPERLASDACDWNSAPRMETSYFSTDAKCAPNAKLKNPRSDTFEIGWGDACGTVEGDNEYAIQNIEC
ncbi:Lytic polysaccharide monooxygenase [Pyrenophora tritici-repentis]|nr:Lytic polysaccharide monooxygenase [Pyrenophora tritici-repentis]